MTTLIPLLDVSRKSPSSVPRLPQLRLTTKEERTALRRLKLPWGGRADQTEFERLVLARLKRIEDPPTEQKQSKAGRVIERLRRRARMIDSFTRKLEKPILGDLSLPIPPFASPPIRELQLYGEKLRACADCLAARSRRRPHRISSPETHAILRLIEFVEQMTGRRQLDSLCVLLRTACRDVGVNERRLNSLLRDHASVFAKARLRVSRLGLPSA
jgi:hypothetical protein